MLETSLFSSSPIFFLIEGCSSIKLRGSGGCFLYIFIKALTWGLRPLLFCWLMLFLGKDHCNRHGKFSGWQRHRELQPELLLSGKQEHNLQMLITSLRYFGNTSSPSLPECLPTAGLPGSVCRGDVAFSGWHTDSRTSWKSCSVCAILNHGKPNKLEQACFDPSLMDHVAQEPARNSEINYTRAFKGEVFSFHWNPGSVFQG